MQTSRRGFFGLLAGAMVALGIKPKPVPLAFHPDAFSIVMVPFDPPTITSNAVYGNQVYLFSHDGIYVLGPDGQRKVSGPIDPADNTRVGTSTYVFGHPVAKRIS